MQNDAAIYLEFIEAETSIEHKFRTASLAFVLVAILTAFFYIRNGGDLLFVAAGFAFVLAVWTGVKRRLDTQSWGREEGLLHTLDIVPELIGSPGVRDRIILAAETGGFNELQVKKMTGSIRGQDEKGFTGGVRGESLDGARQRTDAMVSEAQYEGLEGDLRRSERLVGEANERYTEAAQEQWSDAEKNDQDLIEAGVERLGDLVRTDWFEKNAKTGAVDELMGQSQKE